MHNLLQKLHPKMKFAIELSSKELPFLDILIKNKNGVIIRDIYHKPTNTKRYLHFNSHHLKNCIKSISYILARRICTIIINRGCLRGVMVKAMDCGIVISGFVLQSRYYVHFQANTLGIGMKPLILPAMG